MSNEDLFKLILIACSDDFLSPEEIALVVNKKIDYLKNKIIPKMVLNGQLVSLYPDNITHPNQKYKKAE